MGSKWKLRRSYESTRRTERYRERPNQKRLLKHLGAAGQLQNNDSAGRFPFRSEGYGQGTLILSRRQISEALRSHQKRLQMGDRLVPFTELADRAGLHRDTLYEALHGRRISHTSQARLSTMLTALGAQEKPPSRLMHIQISPNGVALGFGVGPVGGVRR